MADDITGPVYLTRPALGARSARVLSGRGLVQPGYRIIGTQSSGLSNELVVPRVLKMVSPLTGQGPADPRATGRYANMTLNTISVRTVRQSRSVAPNTNYKVVRPPQTAIRRMDSRGQGTVGYI